MIVLETPRGWTGPKGGRGGAGRGHVPGAPGAARRGAQQAPRAPAHARGLDEVLSARGAVRRAPAARARAPGPGARGRAAHGGGPAQQWRRAFEEPHPTLPATTRSTCPSPVRSRPRPRGSPAGSCATSCGSMRNTATSGSWARTRPPRTGSCPVRGHRSGLERRDQGGRRPPRPGRPDDGGPVRAFVPGLARGLPPDRAARLLVLRGIHPRRRFDGRPARQAAEDHAPDPLGQADRVLEPSPLAPGP